ncbi:MAG: FAD-dependent oxidoreductase [Ignavibacteriaceae bacterium]|nr:FAD-dependent oxidoreductase [Ignavibacteriaceae bacterium]
MKRILVIGGGFAGLSAAAFLSHKKFEVILIEASPRLGGRAHSYFDNETSEEIDNGQHILMGCYEHTISFMELIGAYKNLIVQKSLEVNLLKEGTGKVRIKASDIIYPVNLIAAIAGYNALSFNEKLLLIKFFIKLRYIKKDSLKDLTVSEWLNKEKQTENLRKCFWEILAIGALNTSTEKASAQIFYEVLKKIFLSYSDASAIILPKFGLSRTYCQPAKEFIESNGGKVITSDKAVGFDIHNNTLTRVETNKNVYSSFDYVVSAIPYYSLQKIYSISALNIDINFNFSSILNIHIWLKEIPIKENFVALINSPVHWIFNKGSHINIVISDADYLIELSKDEIMELAVSELHKFFGTNWEDILNYKIIKEKRATFIPSNSIQDKRPKAQSIISNLILAGDWIDTGFPSTIESAVKSGKDAADIIAG